MRNAPTIYFGSGDAPTKTVLGGEFKKIRGTAVVALCGINNDGKYKYGDRVAMEDISGVYANIVFCNKRSLENFIKDMESLKKAMEGKWRA